MAESLMAPPPAVDKSAVDAGYGEDFEGFANASGTSSVSAAAGEPESSQLRFQKPQTIHEPDGRPHAARMPQESQPPASQNPKNPQVMAEPAVPATEELSPTEELPRAMVGNALADARRMAEGSGMLQKNPSESPAVSTSEEVTSADVPFSPDLINEPPAAEESLHDSPFKVSTDQSQTQPVPVARQISPALDVSPAASEVIQEPQTQPVEQAPAPVEDAWEPGYSEEFPPSPFDPPEVVAPEPPSDVARGPFLNRLQQFSMILRRELNAQAMFLIDNEGQILLDEVGNPKLIQVARTLANASYRASRQASGSAAVGNLHVKIGASATLEVVPVQSQYGLLILGVIFPAPLGAERVREVADLLYKTVEPSSSR